jgi:alkanesulfonate monooxygenase SsuD/methylene tetrahydromethanopterin reductase-like flavin-dependent oxidoreductase (luciferase family)
MYEQLVVQNGNKVQGFIAYGLYKSAKREWVRKYLADHGRSPKAAEVAAYVSAYTSQTIEAFEAQAAGVLSQFAGGVVADARPEIVEETLKGTFWKAVTQAIVANAAYTVILISLVLVLGAAGIDLLEIATTLAPGRD